MSLKESMETSEEKSRLAKKKLNLLEVINKRDCFYKFVNNIEQIILSYSKEEFIDSLNTVKDVEILEEIRNKLGDYMLEVCDIDSEALMLKRRQSNNARYKLNLSNDIYLLSHFCLDKNLSEEINEIFNIGIKPFDFISEKKKIKLEIDQLYHKLNPVGEKSGNMEETLKTIAVAMNTMQEQMKEVLANQNAMQEQIVKNASDINQVRLAVEYVPSVGVTSDIGQNIS